jgi:hypothetical protein
LAGATPLSFSNGVAIVKPHNFMTDKEKESDEARGDSHAKYSGRLACPAGTVALS